MVIGSRVLRRYRRLSSQIFFVDITDNDERSDVNRLVVINVAKQNSFHYVIRWFKMSGVLGSDCIHLQPFVGVGVKSGLISRLS